MKKIATILLLISLFTGLSASNLLAQWVRPSNLSSTSIVTLNAIGSNIFAGTTDSGLYVSTDNGLTWTSRNSGVTETAVSAILVNGTQLFEGTATGLIESNNNGVSWDSAGLNFYSIQCLSTCPGNAGATYLFAGVTIGSIGMGGTSTVEYSADSGKLWYTAASGLPQSGHVNSMTYCGYNLVAGTSTHGAYVSANTGASWSPTNMGNVPVYQFAVGAVNPFGFDLYAATGGNGIFYSPDNGGDWNLVDSGLTDYNIISVAAGQSESGATVVFAGSDAGQIFLSTDNGVSWTEADSGLSCTTVPVLFVSGHTVFAGTDSGAWHRPIPDVVTGVRRKSNPVPRTYALQQNYPNPFNPSTLISYQLPKESFVRLSVYNVIGQEVRTLVNGMQQPGTKSVRFDGGNLPSGIYFYQLTAGSFSQVKKMMLIR